MAGVEFKGLDELQRNLEAISKQMADEGLAAAEEAAAKLVKQVVTIAAGKYTETGEGKRSVSIFIGKDKGLYATTSRKRLMVGPNKRHGFHLFFIEKGWRHPVGQRKTYYQKYGALGRDARAKGLPGWEFKSGRLERQGRGLAHSQQGASTYKQIPPRQWFPQPSEYEAQAYKEAERALKEFIASNVKGAN